MAPKFLLAALALSLPLSLGLILACSERTETARCAATAGAAGQESAAGGQASVAAAPGAAGEPGASCKPLGKCNADLLDGAVMIDGRPQAKWTATTPDACFDAADTSVAPAQAPCHDIALREDGELRYAPDFLYQSKASIISLDVTLTGAVDHDAVADALIVTQVSGQFTLSAACLAAQPMPLSCAELAQALQRPFAPASSAQCSDAPDGGCACDYDLRQVIDAPEHLEVSDGSGVFELNGANVDPAQSVDYCLRGDTLALTARGGGLGLFTRLPYISHLRTLLLHRAKATP